MSPEKTFTLTSDQMREINSLLGDVDAMLGCLCASADRAKSFNLDTYTELLEDKFGDLLGAFNEATGQTVEDQRSNA